MKSSQILVGAETFMESLSLRANEARESLYIQAMTFEGDVAGELLIDLMINSPAKDKRLIVDSFSKVVVSDHFVFGTRYVKDSEFRAEVKNTQKLIKKARANGVQVKFVNPTWPLMMRYPLRNHKKMMIVDGETSFIGGINFSDHNFGWQDMMVEIRDVSLAKTLVDDFLNTWNRHNHSKKVKCESGDLYLMNGRKSQTLYKELFSLIQEAESSVTVISPYVSEPLLNILSQTSQRGVDVKIISPRENNKGLFYNFLISKCTQASFILKHHPGMFHLKAILIDDKKMVFGSSNFDLISYYFEQEVVLVSEESELVDAFKSQVLVPMEDESVEYTPSETSKSIKSEMIMAFLHLFCRVASSTILSPRS